MSDKPNICKKGELPSVSRGRTNHALGKGGSVDIHNLGDGKLVAAVADPVKLTKEQTAEIAVILASETARLDGKKKPAPVPAQDAPTQ